jgi:cysteine desulfurase
MGTPYFDTNATTPVDPRVAEQVMYYLTEEFGNAGSRTHSFGSSASRTVEQARQQIETAVSLSNGRVVFTSGATESNNLAILGLEDMGVTTGKRHIITSAIEHKAVLEPVELLNTRGFTVDVVAPDTTGRVQLDDILSLLRPDTLLVSIMHVNNETGIIQPIAEIAEALASTQTLFHVDAAQGFGKDIQTLRHPAIDLISISGHKIYGPKGIGALIIKEQSKKERRLKPIMVGGGQEGGLRPGTLAVPLIAGLGKAAELAVEENSSRIERNRSMYSQIHDAALRAGATINGDPAQNIGNVINVSFPGVDSESVMVLFQDRVAISNGAACSSSSYSYSHVLQAMHLPEEIVNSALRISWYHDSESIDWDDLFRDISLLR